MVFKISRLEGVIKTILALTLILALTSLGADCPLKKILKPEFEGEDCLKRSNISWEFYTNIAEEECCREECTEGCCAGGCLRIIKNKKSRVVDNVSYCIIIEQYNWVRRFFVVTNKYTPKEIMEQIFCEAK